MTDESSGEVIRYQRDDGVPALEVRLDAEIVWLSQQQIAELFQTSRENITMHLRNVFDEGELDREATCKDFLQVRQEGARTVSHYNLDAVISVGYRVKSKLATQFRIWATARLRDYLVKGYALNEQRLEQLGSIVRILARSIDELVAGVADVLAGYLPGLTLLRDYDEGRIAVTPGAVPGWMLSLDEARSVIARVATAFGGQDLYPTVEEKAANLLYFVVKDHPLADGNKRSAAALFVTFLARNGALMGADGQPRITNNALAAITLMVAMSDPREKDLMTALLGRMINEGAA